MIRVYGVTAVRPELTDPCHACGIPVGRFDSEREYLYMASERHGEPERPLLRLCCSCTGSLIQEVENFTTAGKRRKRDQWSA